MSSSTLQALLEPASRTTALVNCSDDDLLLAMLALSATGPQDPLLRAAAQAQFVLAATTNGARERLLTQALATSQPALLAEHLARLVNSTRINAQDDVSTLMHLPFADILCSAFCVALTKAHWNPLNYSMLFRFMEGVTDRGTLELLKKFPDYEVIGVADRILRSL